MGECTPAPSILVDQPQVGVLVATAASLGFTLPPFNLLVLSTSRPSEDPDEFLDENTTNWSLVSIGHFWP